MTNIHVINELNNNSIFPANNKKKQLPDSIINAKTDVGRIPGLYKNDDGYRPYTIYKNPGESPSALLVSFSRFATFVLLGSMDFCYF